MRLFIAAIALMGLSACVHTETVKREPASTTVVTPAPAQQPTTTVVRP
jgi:hypothetical protein